GVQPLRAQAGPGDRSVNESEVDVAGEHPADQRLCAGRSQFDCDVGVVAVQRVEECGAQPGRDVGGDADAGDAAELALVHRGRQVVEPSDDVDGQREQDRTGGGEGDVVVGADEKVGAEVTVRV